MRPDKSPLLIYLLHFLCTFCSFGHSSVYWDLVHLCVCARHCPTLRPGDCSPSGSSAHGILQARTLEWVAISSSRRSSWHRDQTSISCVCCFGRQILYGWATREALNGCWWVNTLSLKVMSRGQSVVDKEHIYMEFRKMVMILYSFKKNGIWVVS